MAFEQKNQDEIFVRDILVRCVVGIRPEEREKKQDVLINLSLFGDFTKAAKSDDIADTIDYSSLKKKIISFTENSSYNLVETLAEEIAKICLSDVKVAKVGVWVEKPTALRFAKTVGVHIVRQQN
ncbi:MAG: dihydroneopterin aldolase [Spirochaetales bacterium]|nr:dihydroneopterin aldolase [Spirochaetales bacterium]